jgi:predicted DsbA family dithiol-disulfide isomerase
VTAEQIRREFDADVTLHRRYGIGVGQRDPMRDRFAAAGLEYNRPEIVPNTRFPLRMPELAREQGLHEPFHDRLMDAYWAEATNIGDAGALRKLAASRMTKLCPSARMACWSSRRSSSPGPVPV